MKIQYVANDGTIFNSEDDCLFYERQQRNLDKLESWLKAKASAEDRFTVNFITDLITGPVVEAEEFIRLFNKSLYG